ncbi:MAG: bifunctional pyr operon transcriptional regulator/uracil phosphoribosyltransferase PyrR [Deferribacteraceae bacterium]|nr:bifunctional pyr operon transcriptional regulator/uracil phosphoribosyltransferase PyrR [Deferribacteraceae bacterium]
MKRVIDGSEIARILERLTFQVIETVPDLKELALIGIHRRGVWLAERIRKIIEKHRGILLDLGSLDITFFRDDLGEIDYLPKAFSTDISFSVTGRAILLVDDVLYTGRTVKAALDAISEFGRPSRILMAALVDRGHREYPIHADFIGKKIPTGLSEEVLVHLSEIDGEDNVYIGVPSTDTKIGGNS